MNTNRIDGYVLSNDLRLVIRWAFPFSIITMLGIACLSLKALIEGSRDIVIYVCVSGFFIGIGALLLWYMLQYWKLTSLSFEYKDRTIINHRENIEYRVCVDNSIFATEFAIEYSTKGVVWQETYYLLSNQPFPQLSGADSGGLQSVKFLHEQRLVMLPVNDHTKHWLPQSLGLTQVPSFPQIAYVQNCDH